MLLPAGCSKSGGATAGHLDLLASNALTCDFVITDVNGVACLEGCLPQRFDELVGAASLCAMDSATEDDEWSAYLPALSRAILSWLLLKEPSCDYEQYLEHGMESLREALIDLFVFLPDEYEDFVSFIVAAADAFTSLRHQPKIWMPMCRVRTSLPQVCPLPLEPLQVLDLPTVRSARCPSSYVMKIACGLDCIADLDVRAPLPRSLSWQVVSDIWKELMLKPIDLHALD